jgi:hypothetical protein
MRVLLALSVIVLGGCCARREAYVFQDVPEAYLRSHSVPQSASADEVRAKWFSIGYCEGWQRGNSGESAHPNRWAPEDVSDSREAYLEGFDAGYEAGFEQALEWLGLREPLLPQWEREPDGPANGSQPMRSATNSTPRAAGSRGWPVR